MSAARIQKLSALLKRVEARRAQPRLLPAATAAAGALAAAVAPAVSRAAAPTPDPFAPSTIPPAPDTLPPSPTVSPVASPAAAVAPIVRPEPPSAPAAEPARRAPSGSPLEDAMALLAPDDSGPLQVEALAPPIHAAARMSIPNQDLLLTHRPEAGPSAPPGPIVELVQPKPLTPREPTIEFDTGVKANPLTQRDLKPIGWAEPLQAPTQKLEPAPLAAHAPPARVVSSARHEVAKTFGELLELSLALRPSASSNTRS